MSNKMLTLVFELMFTDVEKCLAKSITLYEVETES